MTKYLQELQGNLGSHKVPEILKDFIDFDISMGDKWYLEQDFKLRIDDILEIFLDANEILEDNIEAITEKLIEFASADDTGGIFVFWLRDGIKNVEDAPIIWFGSEGEIEIRASNFQDLLLQYALEGQPNYDYVTDFPKFNTWVNDYLNLKIIANEEDAEKITQKANTSFKEPLFDWLRKNGAGIYTLQDDF